MVNYIPVKDLIYTNWDDNKNYLLNIEEINFLSINIDSILKEIPITDVVLEIDTNKIIMGKRIIYLIKQFIQNEIVLNNSLKIEPKIRATSFSSLSGLYKEKILNYCFRVIYIEQKYSEFYKIYIENSCKIM